MLALDEKQVPWISAEKCDLEIRYLDVKGTERTYRADFLVDSKALVEVKPIRLHNTALIKAKSMAAEAFCRSKGLEYLLIDPPMLSSEKIKSLHDNKTILFTQRYEKYYQERYA